ncbi:MAG: hypothetical protein KF795_28040 [Labilithrix sp.]|nr:hypothetical protein [Labilithrix sp.]
MKDRSAGGTLAVVAAIMVIMSCSCTDAASPDGGGDADAGGAPEGGVPDGVAPDAAASLNCPAGCLPPAPDGWIGPSAVYDGAPDAKPAACPAQYGVAEIEAHQGLAPAPAVCSCGTAKFADAKCKTVVEYWSTAVCGGFSVTSEGSFPFSQCVGPQAGLAAMRVRPAVYSATCTFESPSKTLPPPDFEKTQMVCGLAATAACTGRPECTSAPAPDAPFSRVCIRKDGEHACPSLDYSVRVISHRGTDDTRDCTPCGDGTAKATCGTTVTGWVGGDCTGTQIPTVVGSCYEGRRYVDLKDTGPVNPTCEPEQGGNQPTGALALKDPVTFCCNQ